MTALALEREPVAATGDAAPPNPYPGLRPFVEAEAELFFGREREIATVVRLLEERQLVVVHGASGCGKSSVVRAGVVPVFRLDALAGDADARVIIIRPADAGGPLASLARKLEREFPRDAAACAIGGRPAGGTARPWSEVLAASPDCARDIAAAAQAAGATLCLIIDQFEEIFAVNRAGHAAEARRVVEFLISLGEPAAPGSVLGERPLSVILTMRSDYLGHCALWDGFAEAVNRCQYLLPKLSAVGLLRSIHEPARLGGGSVDEAVADRLLPLMGREVDGLPILQHALMRSWAVSATEAGAHRVTTGVLDSIGGVEHALSRHAEEAFALATGGDRAREDAADWIFRSLSDLDTDGRIIRRSLLLSDLVTETGADSPLVRAILDVFRAPEFSLLTPYAPEPLEDRCIISVSHEALLRQWERVNDIRFDEKGRPRGLVFREAQDGMIARALSVQAETFAAEGEGVLGPAATEQRLPWFEEVARRPGWIARYPLRREPDPRAHAEQQWGNLSQLMAASKANLEKERDKLGAERAMVARLRSSRWSVIAMTGALILSMGVIAQQIVNDEEEKAAAAAVAAKTEAQARITAARDAETTARGQLEQVYLSTAGFLAQRECAGRGLPAGQCPTDVQRRYYGELKRISDTGVQIDPSTNQAVGLTPYASMGGGVRE